MDKSYLKIGPCALIKTTMLIPPILGFPYAFDLKMSQGPFIRRICNNPANPRAISVNDSEISGAKRTEFCLQTG